ncbi:MAG: 50S ribosomal protein L10 [Candidatus Omnitrophica bacterium]|jgi:large subunit ribosomal protein L10|nr:50S ribosomal protein L10 [Candidatus Omnitrophota bacterium]MDD3988138.1 50S ribosomal protein L10 [Candidatus Omnitrophota bacterium]MDD4981667.1 50S ribosomal protein L10 [Candidatus Omnitrophota bacterium]MDD5664928.1 50S ribosomal protein L10 [Candidatus Omnitrophota bacterium]
MKKIGLVFKEVSESRIKTTLKDSDAVFIIKYSGVASPDLCSLRQTLKGSKASLFVVKNSVARRALKDSGLEVLVKNIEGPCGMVFIKDEPVAISKSLFEFVKEHEQLKIEGGSLKDKVLEKSDIEAMSKLASKEVLRAQVVMTLNSPISGIVITLNQILAKFVYCIDQIKQKKES